MNIETMVGLGEVIRQTNGEWVLGFHRLCYASDPLMAELMDINAAIQLVVHEDIRGVSIFSDRKVRVDLAIVSSVPDIMINMGFGTRKRNKLKAYVFSSIKINVKNGK